MASLEDETLAYMREIGLAGKGGAGGKKQKQKPQQDTKQAKKHDKKPAAPVKPRAQPKVPIQRAQDNKNAPRKRKLAPEPAAPAPPSAQVPKHEGKHIKFVNGEADDAIYSWAQSGVSFPLFKAGEVTEKWYSISSELAEPTKQSRKQQRPLSYEVIQSMREAAEGVWQSEISAFANESRRTQSSDQKWVQDVIKTGTLSDKIAGLTLLVQQSPVHNTSLLDTLVSMAVKKERRAAQLAMRALKDLLINDLLPARRLIRFDQRMLRHPGVTARHIVLYLYEDYLKMKYMEVIRGLEEGLKDTIESFKRFCLDVCYDLLVHKPEREDVLLRMIVNKLGDPSKKIAGRALELLVKLTRKHSAMIETVVDEVQGFLQRQNLAQRASFNAVIFLNSLRFSRTAESAKAAEKVIGLYFTLFEQNLQGDDADEGKIIAALLTGVNRAFPYLHNPSSAFKEKLETLFKIVHSSSFNTSVQALGLLFQLVNVPSDAESTLKTRFYRALYSTLLSEELVSRSRNTVLLNLVYRAIKNDDEPARVLAFCKRMTAMALQSTSPIAAACIRLLSVALEAQPQVRSSIVAPQKLVVQKSAVEAEPGTTEEKANDDSEENAPLVYDPLKREPLYAVQGNPGAWEGVLYRSHFHPSVSRMADNFYANQPIGYDGDPMVDFSLRSFLDRFTYKNPKQTHVQNAKKATDQAPMNSSSFLEQRAREVAPETMFFHKYFNDLHKLQDAGLTRRKKKAAKGDHAERALFGEDAEEEAEMDRFADELAEGLMRDHAAGTGAPLDDDFDSDLEDFDGMPGPDEDGPVMDEFDDDNDDDDDGNEGGNAAGMGEFSDDDENDDLNGFDDFDDFVPDKKKTKKSRGDKDQPVFAAVEDYEDLAQEIYSGVAGAETPAFEAEAEDGKPSKRKKAQQSTKRSKLRRK